MLSEWGKKKFIKESSIPKSIKLFPILLGILGLSTLLSSLLGDIYIVKRLELWLFDNLPTLRRDGPDKIIYIIAVDDSISHEGSISDEQAVEIINALNEYSPEVIAFNIDIDASRQRSKDFVSLVQRQENVFFSDTYSDIFGHNPFEYLENLIETNQINLKYEERVGFRDIPPDEDFFERINASNGVGEIALSPDDRGQYTPNERLITLSEWVDEENNVHDISSIYRSSISFLVAEYYLQARWYKLCTVKDDQAAFLRTTRPCRNPDSYDADELSGVIIPQVSNSERFEGLRSLTDGVLNTFINERIARKPFHVQTINSVDEINIPMEGSIVILSESKETFEYPSYYTTEIHAHNISQLINATLNGRPLINSLTSELSILIVFVAALSSLLLFILCSKNQEYYIIVILPLFALLTLLIHILFLNYLGIWISITPSIASFCLVCLFTRLHIIELEYVVSDLADDLEEKNELIDEAVHQIHRGSLQKFTPFLHSLDADPSVNPKYAFECRKIIKEIRDDLHSLKEFSQKDNIIISKESVFDKNVPINVILERAFSEAIYKDENVPVFDQLNRIVQTSYFEEIPKKFKDIALPQKRALVRFIDEAVTNAGKYALGADVVTAEGKVIGNKYIISVQDNGIGILNQQIPNKGVGFTVVFDRCERVLRGKLKTSYLDKQSRKGTNISITFPLPMNRKNLISMLVEKLKCLTCDFNSSKKHF